MMNDDELETKADQLNEMIDLECSPGMVPDPRDAQAIYEKVMLHCRTMVAGLTEDIER